MGACYSKRAGQLGEAYSHPVRSGSPARLRKRSAMSRPAPYSRQSGPAARPASSAGPPGHSFGFRRRAVTAAGGGGGSGGGGGGGVGSHRVQPVPPPNARRAAATPSSTSSESVGPGSGDQNGNQKAGKRLMPKPLVVRVKPRVTNVKSTATNVANSTQTGSLTHGGHASSARVARSTHSANSAHSSHSGHSNSATSIQSTSSVRSITPPKTNSAAHASFRSGETAEIVSPRQGSRGQMDDSGVGTMRGSLTSTLSTLSETVSPEDCQRLDTPQRMTQTMPNVPENLESHQNAGEMESEPGDIRDFQVGIQTGEATIALSVNIHKGASPALRQPQVTVHDSGGRARVTQIQRPGFGFTQPAGLTRPVRSAGVSRFGAAPGAVGNTSAQSGGALSSGTNHSGTNSVASIRSSNVSGMGSDNRVDVGGIGDIVGAGGMGHTANVPSRPTHLISPKSAPPPPPRTVSLDQTVRSRVTRWEEKVDQVRRETIGTPSVRSAGRSERPLSGGTPSLAVLRREVKHLTRDVATSPLRRPPLKDTGTCTDAHVLRSGHVGHGSPAERAKHVAGKHEPHVMDSSHVSQDSSQISDTGSPVDVLSPLNSNESPESRTGNEDFIDDEIGDQPAFGAYGSESLSPGAFLEDMLNVGLSDPTSPPLPPLQITEAIRDDYVRPFRLTPRPLTSITTLETPLRRWAAETGTSASEQHRQTAGGQAAESGSTASERRRQMEERAEQLARRLGFSEGTPLGTTYQRLGLPDPATPESNTGTESIQDLAKTLTQAETSTPVMTPTPIPIKNKPILSSSKAVTSSPETSIPGHSTDQSSAIRAPRGLSTARKSSPEPAVFESPECDVVSTISQPEVKAKATSPDTTPDKATAMPASTEVSATYACEISSAKAKTAGVSSSSFEASLLPSTSDDVAGPKSDDVMPCEKGDDVTGREEESLSDLESRDEATAGCRPRRASWRRFSELRELTSPTESLNSDILMADFDKDWDDAIEDDDSLTGQVSRLQRMRLRASGSADTGRPSPDPTSKLLRPPRQNSAQDSDDWLLIDRDTYMYMSQDFTHAKTMLHKLRRLLQDAETTNPFENSLQATRRGTSVSSESQLSSLDGRRSVDGGADLAAENADLKRQVSSLQQTVSDQARTIRLLQQQMGSSSADSPTDVSTVATQATQVVTEETNVITVAPECR